MLILWNCFWLIFPTLLYADATHQKIGRIKGDKSFVNMPAGAWGMSMILLGIFALPFYLFNRGKLIAKAQTNPVVVSTGHRVLVAVVLVAANVGLAILSSKLHGATPQSIGHP